MLIVISNCSLDLRSSASRLVHMLLCMSNGHAISKGGTDAVGRGGPGGGWDDSCTPSRNPTGTSGSMCDFLIMDPFEAEF